MQSSYKRVLGVLVVGAALALPAAAWAQQGAPQQATPASSPKKEEVKPTTAPTSKANADKMPATAGAPTPDAPKVGSPPKPGQGSTAVPGWNNPPAWGTASERPQYASIPGVDTNRLIQGAGREWREFRNGPMTQMGGWLLVIVLALLAIFYLIKGKIRLHGQPTGRLIERFNAVERASHWVMAISFVFLAITGIVILFGKHIVLPWLGYTGFAWLSVVSKNIHNFVGPLFIFSMLVMFLVFVRDNMFRSYDWKWIGKFGGMFSKGGEVPSGRFNGMEKMWFWGGLVLLGTIVSITGLILDFPNWNQGRQLMQQANVIHAIAAILFIAGAFGHIYIGTIGMEGAYRGMRDGYVDETWAREHHSLWYDEIKAGRRPERIVAPTAQPVAGDD
jgi:formate dehydrogenase subunit gamma